MSEEEVEALGEEETGERGYVKVPRFMSKLERRTQNARSASAAPFQPPCCVPCEFQSLWRLYHRLSRVLPGRKAVAAVLHIHRVPCTE